MIGLLDRNCPFLVKNAQQSRSNAGEEQDNRAEISVVFTFSVSASRRIRWMLDFAQSLQRPFSLYLIDSGSTLRKDTIEISSLMTGVIKRLYFYQSCFLFSEKCIALCKCPTQLVFTGHSIELNKSIFTALCTSVNDHHLPKLAHLSFSGCEKSLKVKMQYLFEKPWPTLTHLDVSGCFLDEEDVRIICAAAENNLKQNSLPKLSSLAISPKYIEVDEKCEFLKKPWNELKSLEISGAELYFARSMHEQPIQYYAYTVFMNALSQDRFPNLEQLGTSEYFMKQFKHLKYLKSLKLNKGRSRYDVMLLDVKQLSEDFGFLSWNKLI